MWETSYIFLDEIQKVPSFEKVVDSLYVKEHTDVYITGSNAYMLSGDLATLLTGRYVEISILPLSYKEYCQIANDTSDKTFAEYLKNGGLPYIAKYLASVVGKVILKANKKLYMVDLGLRDHILPKKLLTGK